jgi:hypothetical protein
MSARVTMRNEDGSPACVETDDGFCLNSGPYDPDQHGWIEGQLNPNDFMAITIGRQTEWLVDQVNALRRKNWDLERRVKMWTDAAGFGKKG